MEGGGRGWGREGGARADVPKGETEVLGDVPKRRGKRRSHLKGGGGRGPEGRGGEASLIIEMAGHWAKLMPIDFSFFLTSFSRFEKLYFFFFMRNNSPSFSFSFFPAKKET